MKAVIRPSSWIVILAVVGHGAVPGVVLCSEFEGHVRVEAMGVECCVEEPGSSEVDRMFHPLLSGVSERDSSCGPCTDSPVSPVPVTKPARNDAGVLATLPTAVVALVPAMLKVTARAPDPAVGMQASLISIKTTTLLI